MAKKLPSVDVVLVGFGWTGAILGQELTDAGLNVVAIERGGWRDTPTDFAVSARPWRYVPCAAPAVSSDSSWSPESSVMRSSAGERFRPAAVSEGICSTS